ncbi:glutamine amidotransferase [Legionella gratiana]|uniref:Glutamine amidotransferase n=1 Tax=Legionella gratiana TaxID=45066 RepID=A0A378JCL9_9GAMM|nr:class II glutamine amidotransferase [Legionella gratiana]KTD06544.1 glutamine amidotransferase [Legionella gratiana]STX45365.1 glutamine amidotransferase [Legionella gratiana]
MCRFVAYIGKESILLSDLLIRPKNSLVKQSLISQESHTVTNGDGFGVGWYTPFDKKPALFTSLFPAWNDQNLSYLAKKTKSSLFFAHVRAASTGGISQFNCHPFIYKNWLFMHNGWIPHFEKIRRQIHNLLEDDIYNWIKGTTDSELIFALFLQMSKQIKIRNSLDIHTVLLEVLTLINNLVRKNYKRAVCYFNICITNGKHIVAFRYCPSSQAKPETMYFCRDNSISEYIIIASEKLSTKGFKWEIIPRNHSLLIESDFTLSLKEL